MIEIITEQINNWMNGWMNGWIDWWMKGWINWYMNECMNDGLNGGTISDEPGYNVYVSASMVCNNCYRVEPFIILCRARATILKQLTRTWSVNVIDENPAIISQIWFTGSRSQSMLNWSRPSFRCRYRYKVCLTVSFSVQ